MQNDWFIYYLIALATFAIGIAIYNITSICIKHVLSELQEKPEFKRRPKPDPEATNQPIINPIKNQASIKENNTKSLNTLIKSIGIIACIVSTIPIISVAYKSYKLNQFLSGISQTAKEALQQPVIIQETNKRNDTKAVEKSQAKKAEAKPIKCDRDYGNICCIDKTDGRPFCFSKQEN